MAYRTRGLMKFAEFWTDEWAESKREDRSGKVRIT